MAQFMSQCLSISLLSRDSVLLWIPLPSDMNPTFTPGKQIVTEIYELNVGYSQQERFHTY